MLVHNNFFFSYTGGSYFQKQYCDRPVETPKKSLFVLTKLPIGSLVFVAFLKSFDWLLASLQVYHFR